VIAIVIGQRKSARGGRRSTITITTTIITTMSGSTIKWQ
jgi:hypothetical protein